MVMDGMLDSSELLLRQQATTWYPRCCKALVNYCNTLCHSEVIVYYNGTV